jgi:hypothetical protein
MQVPAHCSRAMGAAKLSQLLFCHEHGDHESARNDHGRYGDREQDPVDHEGPGQSFRPFMARGRGTLPLDVMTSNF